MTLDSTTTLTNFNSFFIVVGTAALSSLSCEIDFDSNIPQKSISYVQLNSGKDWSIESENPIVSIDQMHILEKIKTLKSFSALVLEGAHSLDEEAMEIVNENFWDWI